ncbi:MAG: WD40 repeat domain-containing protein [Methanoregula sp.]|jgi:WD40 repeat protein
MPDIRFMVPVLLIGICLLAASVSGLTINSAWKATSPAGQPMSGVTMSDDGSWVFVSSNTMGVSAQGNVLWGGYDGGSGVMSDDGSCVVTASGTSIRMLDSSGSAVWSRSMGSPVTAVAVSPNASIVATADSAGYLRTWGKNGESYGTILLEPAVAMGVVPSSDLVVLSTNMGMRGVSPGLSLVWSDNRTDIVESFIVIPPEGSVIYAAGGGTVTAYTQGGSVSWQKKVSSQSITDISSSGNGRVIAIGSGDGKVYILDSTGTVKSAYSAGQAVNAVSVSRDGSRVAVASIDNQLVILNRDGSVAGSISTPATIQQRSVALNSGGSFVAAADKINLYGYTISPDPVLTTPTSRVKTTLMTATHVSTELPTSSVTVESTEVTDTETPAPTQSPLSVVPAIIALGIFAIFLKRRN